EHRRHGEIATVTIVIAATVTVEAVGKEVAHARTTATGIVIAVATEIAMIAEVLGETIAIETGGIVVTEVPQFSAGFISFTIVVVQATFRSLILILLNSKKSRFHLCGVKNVRKSCCGYCQMDLFLLKNSYSSS
ncbi:hypothetical protein ANCCAN_23328, partial [Ancylostoma caninum]